MQLAGEICKTCGESIFLQTDGTWCGRCKTIFHTKCAGGKGSVCPTCRQTFEWPEVAFAFSKLCPECLTPNQPSNEKCSRCHARTVWDTAAEYEAFRTHVQAVARRCLIRGTIELAVGLLFLLPIAVLLLKGGTRINPIGASIGGFVLFTTDGAIQLLKGFRLFKFS